MKPKEKIIEIITKNYQNEKSDFPPDSATEIAALIEREYHEKEFTEWCIRDVFYNPDGTYGILDEDKLGDITMDKVFKFWITNVKK